MLKCQECGHENDVTRVFCQNCGTRLDRTQETTTGAAPPPKAEGAVAGASFKTSPATKPKLPPGQKASRSIVFVIIGAVLKFVALVVLAAIIAGIIQMLRVPDFRIPPPERGAEGLAVQLTQVVKLSAESPYPRSYDLKENMVNNYLQARILPMPTEEGSGLNVHAQFIRTFMVIRSGYFEFVVEQKIADRPVYIYLNVTPVTTAAGTDVKITSGGIGRLRLDERFVPMLMEKFFLPITSVLTDQIAMLATATGTELHETQATLRWPGKTPPGR